MTLCEAYVLILRVMKGTVDSNERDGGYLSLNEEIKEFDAYRLVQFVKYMHFIFLRTLFRCVVPVVFQ
jgi:hypothetical protein